MYTHIKVHHIIYTFYLGTTIVPCMIYHNKLYKKKLLVNGRVSLLVNLTNWLLKSRSFILFSIHVQKWINRPHNPLTFFCVTNSLPPPPTLNLFLIELTVSKSVWNSLFRVKKKLLHYPFQRELLKSKQLFFSIKAFTNNHFIIASNKFVHLAQFVWLEGKEGAPFPSIFVSHPIFRGV